MTLETELKLRIAPENMGRLKRHPFLRSIAGERASTRKLYSVYFDTPDLQLHQARMALRLRRDRSRWLQTLKGGGGVQAGLHQRNEWETPVPSQALDFSVLEQVGASGIHPHWRKNIQAIFVTDFSRCIYLVQFEGATIEVSMDLGVVTAGTLNHPISELELELKSGTPFQLFQLALKLLEIVPLAIEVTSKAEYGYRLHTQEEVRISKAQNPKLERVMPTGEALQSLIWSCLLHLQANVSGALATADEEYLHQVRVALRRLRVVLRMANSYRKDAELEVLQHLVAQLGTTLGSAREWDVLLMQTLPDIQKSQDIRQLVRQCEQQRQYHQQCAQTLLKSADFQRMLLRLGAWMYGGYWQQATDNNELVLFAGKRLNRCRNKVTVRGECLTPEIEVKQLHQLRIACKHLRYSADMLSSLYDKKTVEHYLLHLAKLQDCLGELNDQTVALSLLQALPLPAQQQNIKLIQTYLEQRRPDCLNAMNKTWKKFSAIPPFWS